MANFIPKIEYGTGPTTIQFVYPPESDDGEQFEAVKRESISISGVRQVSVDRTDIIRSVKFKFLTPALKTSLQTFFDSWAKYGKSFKYFESSDEVAFETYELLELKLPTSRDLPKAGDFLYSAQFKFRRYE